MFSTIYLRLEGRYPPPRNEKLGFHVKVTFQFRLMFPPPNEKVEFQVKVHFGSE